MRCACATTHYGSESGPAGTDHRPDSSLSQGPARARAGGYRRRLGRARLGRDIQDQSAQAALAANLLDPHFVQIVCGTLNELPRTFAVLEQAGTATTQPVLDCDQRHSNLRRRIRELAPVPSHVLTNSLPHSGKHPQNP